MFKNNFKKKNSVFLLQNSTLNSESFKKCNTSLTVNAKDSVCDELPEEIVSALTEEGFVDNKNRNSPDKFQSQKARSASLKLDFGIEPPDGKIESDVLPSFSTITREIPLTNSNQNQNQVPYFEKVLKTCGAVSLNSNSTYLLCEDHTIFSLKINNILKQSNNKITCFLDSLKEGLMNASAVQKMLAHTLTSDDCEVARGPVQDSMIRILLNVSCLQESLIDIIFQKLGDLVINSKDCKSSDLASSILNQMRFINLHKNVKIASRLFEILYLAPKNLQREIIFIMPEIITRDEMEEVSMKLLNMLKEDNDLTNVILDSITNLILDKTVISEVRSKAFNRLDKCALEFLPSLVQFILSKCDEDEFSQVIDGLRHNLPFSAKHIDMEKKKEKQTDENKYLKTTFDIIKFSTLASKQMAEAWIKAISSSSCSNEFRCLDLMMLIILYATLSSKKTQILSLIRVKIKSQILTKSQVSELFKTLTTMVTEYFSAVLEMATILIKSVNPVIADVGAQFYKECFLHFHFYAQQAVVNEILLLVAMGLPTTVDTVLSTLKYFCENNKETLVPHTSSIMGLLNKISDLDALQIRLLMDIISNIIFSDSLELATRWQDEVEIFIRKQVMSPNLEVSKKGIVAAVTLGKHVEEHHTSDFEQTIILLVMAMGSVGNSDVKKTFFNDELAATILILQMSSPILSFWAEKIRKKFENILFVQNTDITCEHFATSLQYFSTTKQNKNVVLPVVNLVTRSHADETSDIPLTVIPSAFKLLWCDEKNFDAALFSASVAMPEVTIYDKFQNFKDNTKKIVMDCLFLCANYLIECINAFCFHNILEEASLRILQLLAVRKEILRLLPFLPDYQPVRCHFHSPVQKIIAKKTEAKKCQKNQGKSKKRKRKAEGSIESSSSALDFETKKTNFCDLSSSFLNLGSANARIPENRKKDELAETYTSFFRELHVVCLKLLKLDLTVTDEIDNHHLYWQRFRSSSKVGVCTVVASFLLKNGIEKGKKILMKEDAVFKKRPVFLQMDESNPAKFVDHVLSILPGLMKKMEVWSAYCKDLIRKNEGILDGPGMYSKDSECVKEALANALEFMSEIISWPGFEKPENKSLLKMILNILSKNETVSSENWKIFIRSAAPLAANYLASFCEGVLVLNGGVSIIRAVRSCLNFGSSNGSFRLLAETCLKMLRSKWFTSTGNPEKGAAYNKNISFLVKTYFSVVDDSLEVMKNMASTVADEVGGLTDENSSLNTIKSVHRYSFSIFYQVMCEALVSASSKELGKGDESAQLFQIWSNIVEIMLMLVSIVKIRSSRGSLAALLKHSQSIIQLFFGSGLATVESALRTNFVDTLKLLKSLQKVTRFLHSICCHSKITNDSLVAAHVPAIRAQCERLTLEVKGMLISNKIPMECMTIAILKNKDIEGNDILSQESLSGHSEDDSESAMEEPDESPEEKDADNNFSE